MPRPMQSPQATLTAMMIAFALAAVIAAGAARAQAISGAFDQLKVSPDQPIEIESDTLTVRQSDSQAVFDGNVKAVRGPMVLTTPRLVVDYVDGRKSAGGGGTEITKLDARGGVKVVSRDQSATGQWAVMDVPASTITLGGNVVLRQGKNVIRGSRLDVDLTTGLSKLTGAKNNGRVRGVFVPKRKDK